MANNTILSLFQLWNCTSQQDAAWLSSRVGTGAYITPTDTWPAFSVFINRWDAVSNCSQIFLIPRGGDMKRSKTYVIYHPRGTDLWSKVIIYPYYPPICPGSGGGGFNWLVHKFKNGCEQSMILTYDLTSIRSVHKKNLHRFVCRRKLCKALAKRSQHLKATFSNIVGRNMLRTFGHPVATCWDMLGIENRFSVCAWAQHKGTLNVSMSMSMRSNMRTTFHF